MRIFRLIFAYIFWPFYVSVIVATKALWRPWRELPRLVKRFFNKELWFHCLVCGQLNHVDSVDGKDILCENCELEFQEFAKYSYERICS